MRTDVLMFKVHKKKADSTPTYSVSLRIACETKCFPLLPALVRIILVSLRHPNRGRQRNPPFYGRVGGRETADVRVHKADRRVSSPSTIRIGTSPKGRREDRLCTYRLSVSLSLYRSRSFRVTRKNFPRSPPKRSALGALIS